MTSDTKFDKKIKKNIYGQAQRVKAIFPPGFGTLALDEINNILNNPWFPQKIISECSLLENEIRIAPIHLFSAIELLLRSQCLADIRLVIYEGKAFGKNAFEKKCRDIDWDFYINNRMTIKIKVESIASNAFHETGLKHILSDILKKYAGDIVTGENANETTMVYADLYKDRLTLSISLAGAPLYKRGYRGKLSASAPLREDAAFCCIKKSLQFAKALNSQFSSDQVIIPFSGTGTFAFEYLQFYYQFSPVLFGRDYALQKMSLFRPEHFNFLLKKAHEKCLFNHSTLNGLTMLCVDNSENANSALLSNWDAFKKIIEINGFLLPDNLRFESKPDNFLAMDFSSILSAKKNLFLPLNPPYGIRMGKDSVLLYKKIAVKINEIATLIKQNQRCLLGFILCPDEASWLAFSKNLLFSKTETYHFTQGGMDVRICQFFIC